MKKTIKEVKENVAALKIQTITDLTRKMENKIESLSVEQVKDALRQLVKIDGDGVETACEFCFAYLNKKLASFEFIAFCAELEKSI